MASIIEKLQKLINHERSARDIGSAAEAETFAGHIQKLLTEHKLSMSEVEFEAQDIADPIGETMLHGAKANLPVWKMYLAKSIAESLFCRNLGFKKSSSVSFIGRKSDCQTCADMYTYLVGLAKSLCKKDADAYMGGATIVKFKADVLAKGYASESMDRWLKKTRREFEKSFLLAYGWKILERLATNKQAIDPQAAGQGLILRDTLAIDKYIEDNMSVENSVRRPPVAGHAAGAAAGESRGDSISLKSRTALGA